MKIGQKKGENLDLIGKRFGNLTVIKLSKRNENKRYQWYCECDCGKTKLCFQDLLTSGKNKSCGCLLVEARKAENKNPDRDIALIKLLYSPLKKRHRAKFKNENYLTFDDFKSLTLGECYYCKTASSNTLSDIRYDGKNKIIVSNTKLSFNGIDRIDSSLGYTKQNSVSCCRHCNTAKNSMPIDEFRQWVIRIYLNWIK